MPDATQHAAPPDEAFRLPRSVEPMRYVLELRPDLETASFSGDVAIDVVVHEHLETIVANAAELTLDVAAIELSDGTVLDATVSFEPEHDRVRFTFDQRLPTGPATLRCSFAGDLNDKLRGFYRSTFTDDAGRDPHHRHDPDGVDGRPSGVPVLGRARSQGGLRGHPGRGRGPGRLLELPRGRRDDRRRQATGALRTHDEDVHLPRRLRGGTVRCDAARRRRWRAGRASFTHRARPT